MCNDRQAADWMSVLLLLLLLLLLFEEEGGGMVPECVDEQNKTTQDEAAGRSLLQ